VSDICGAKPPNVEDWVVTEEHGGQRCRSMSDVDQLPEDMGVVSVLDGETWLAPIIIDVAPDMPSSPVPLEYHVSSSSEPRHKDLYRWHTESEIGDQVAASAHRGGGRRSDEGLGEMTSGAREGKAHASHLSGRRAAATGEGDGVAEGDSSNDALLDWSAVHGSFAEVLRGMSPPPSIGMPPSPDLQMGGKSAAA